MTGSRLDKVKLTEKLDRETILKVEKVLSSSVFVEIANLQADYINLCIKGILTKKAMCDLVVPFRDKYNLTDLEALSIARSELTLTQTIKILTEKAN